MTAARSFRWTKRNVWELPGGNSTDKPDSGVINLKTRAGSSFISTCSTAAPAEASHSSERGLIEPEGFDSSNGAATDAESGRRQNYRDDLKDSIHRSTKEILLHSSNSLAVRSRSNKRRLTASKGSNSSTSGKSICTPNSSSRTAGRFTIRSESQPGIASNVLAVLISSRVALESAASPTSVCDSSSTLAERDTHKRQRLSIPERASSPSPIRD